MKFCMYCISDYLDRLYSYECDRQLKEQEHFNQKILPIYSSNSMNLWSHGGSLRLAKFIMEGFGK